ncbi:WD40 repeat protein [Kibdelosporangium banguiense]|uniref:WD40 repeat protein n=1 Tax=Kibdelosporangium banguiense TaxID=1365924 RepID=A0ABS4TY41_9PSEU|nr:NB-ARC domain-containing protein [Kibdelosporangium banguiense]MBP2329322.1 WD40 repeat protein [Kibdelosporangium banguiense]
MSPWKRGSGRRAPAPLDVAGGFVPRPELTDTIVRLLLTDSLMQSGWGLKWRSGFTIEVTGAAGCGKTALVSEVCARDDVKAAFSRIEWVDVGQEVRGRAAVAEIIDTTSARVGGQPPGITNPRQAGLRLEKELQSPTGWSLLIVDDVWTSEQVDPYLNVRNNYTLLVITGIPDLPLRYAPTVKVDQMSQAQARELLTGGLTDLPRKLGKHLLERIGRWPLALTLANAALRRAAREGAGITYTATRLLRRLQELGPSVRDITEAARRDWTVAALLGSSLGMLGAHRDRVVELAIFPETTEIPLNLAALLWQRTAGLSKEDSFRLTHDLAELSLVTWRAGRSTLRVHHLIRTCLRQECGPTRLTELHNVLLDAIASTLTVSTVTEERAVPWWTLSKSAEYLWRTLTYHLRGAGRTDELHTLVTAPHWVIEKIRTFGSVAVAADLALADTAAAQELSRFLDQFGQLLVPGTPSHAVISALAHRLPASPALEELCRAAEAETAGLPRLVPLRDLPDPPDPALIRVLNGHDDYVCFAFTPDGTRLVSTTSDGIRVWHPASGRLIQHIADTVADDIVVSPDGRFVAVEADGNTIELRDTETWQVRTVLRGHLQWLCSFCFMADGRTFVSTSNDNTLRVWDVGTGEQLTSIETPEPLRECAETPDGSLLSLDDEGLKRWDLTSGSYTGLLTIESLDETGLAISPDQRWAITFDDGLKVHDLNEITNPPRTLRHLTELTAAVFSPDSTTLAVGDADGFIVLWNSTSWRPIREISGHGDSVFELAFAPDGLSLASASTDGTVRLWNPALARRKITDRKAVDDETRIFAAALDGSWLAAARSRSVAVYDTASARVHEILEFSDPVYGLATTAGGALVVELFAEVQVRAPNDGEHTSRSLRHTLDLGIGYMTANGDLVCVTDSDDRVIVWDVATWQPPVFIEVAEPGPRIVDRQVAEANSMTNRLAHQTRTDPKRGACVSVKIAPDSQWLAILAGKTIYVVRPKTAENIATLAFAQQVDGIQITPNGRLLAVRINKTIQYWNTSSWKKETEFTDHNKATSAHNGTWSPDCSVTVATSADRTLQIFDSADWTCLTKLRIDDELRSYVWLDNNRLVAIGGHGFYWLTYHPGSRRS